MKLHKSKIKSTELSNASRGKSFEEETCQLLKALGFIAHNCKNDGLSGQPCDIIAMHLPVGMLLDCKRVERGTKFYFKNIEDNQYICFKYAPIYNNVHYCGFVIKLDETGQVYYLPAHLVIALGEDWRRGNVDCTQLQLFNKVASTWRKEYESKNQQ